MQSEEHQKPHFVVLLVLGAGPEAAAEAYPGILTTGREDRVSTEIQLWRVWDSEESDEAFGARLRNTGRYMSFR